MKLTMFKISIAAICLLLLVVVSPVSAQEGGKMIFKPGLGVKVLFDDNIYSGNGTSTTGESEQSDIITHVQPGVHLVYNIPERGTIDFGYDGIFANYADKSSNDWTSHGLSIRLNYKSPKGILADAGYNFVDTEDPFGSPNEYALGVTKGRVNQGLNSRLGFDFGNGFRAMGYYNYDTQDYDLDADADQNSVSHEYGGGIEKLIAPKTFGFVRYYNGSKDYDSASVTAPANDANSKWSRVNFGVTWDASEKLSGEINLGYMWMDYDHYTDQNDFIAATSVNYQMNEKTGLTVNFARAIHESSGNPSGSTDQMTTDTGFGVTLSHKFNTRIAGQAGFNYAVQDYYNPSSREDKNQTYDLGLSYQFQKWLVAGVGYNYSNKDSSDNDNDFTKNQYMFTLKAYMP